MGSARSQDVLISVENIAGRQGHKPSNSQSLMEPHCIKIESQRYRISDVQPIKDPPEALEWNG